VQVNTEWGEVVVGMGGKGERGGKGGTEWDAEGKEGGENHRGLPAYGIYNHLYSKKPYLSIAS